MNQVKVTENLRRSWANQRAQMLEERTHTQHGIARSAEDIAVVDFDIEVMDRLLSLPVGTKFNAQEVQKEMLAERKAKA